MSLSSERKVIECGCSNIPELPLGCPNDETITNPQPIWKLISCYVVMSRCSKVKGEMWPTQFYLNWISNGGNENANKQSGIDIYFSDKYVPVAGQIQTHLFFRQICFSGKVRFKTAHSHPQLLQHPSGYAISLKVKKRTNLKDKTMRSRKEGRITPTRLKTILLRLRTPDLILSRMQTFEGHK